MTAQELRIGNIIFDISHRPCMVDAISNRNFVKLTELNNDYTSESFQMMDCNPIPLTEEWLLKFGFSIDGKYLYIGIEDYKYCFNYRDWADNWAFYVEYTDSPHEKDEGVKYPVSFDIKYVHQLQNLYFSLTGEEL
jgi:uncharacterized membrane protein